MIFLGLFLLTVTFFVSRKAAKERAFQAPQYKEHTISKYSKHHCDLKFWKNRGRHYILRCDVCHRTVRKPGNMVVTNE
jgi:hypothetical protein